MKVFRRRAFRSVRSCPEYYQSSIYVDSPTLIRKLVQEGAVFSTSYFVHELSRARVVSCTSCFIDEFGRRAFRRRIVSSVTRFVDEVFRW